MPPAAVCNQFARFENHNLLWKPSASTVATSFHEDGEPITDPISKIPMSCYEVVLWAAHETGVADNVIWGVIDDLFRASARKNKPTTASIVGGLKKYYASRVCMRIFGSYPAKGDLVLFSAEKTEYLAHVAMATGNKFEVLTFGHDGPANTGTGGAPLPVERLTITEVLEANTGLTRVEFGTPPW